MKSVMTTIITVAATAGIAFGIIQVLNRQSSVVTSAPQPSQIPQVQPVPQPVSQSTVAQPSQPIAATASIPFEQLPLCEQLDGIAKSEKSVAQFIANSGRYSDFALQIQANCNWHAQQLQTANAILNPPVVEVPVRTVVRPDPVVVPAPNPKPPSAWNNCNGIQEPGETYSPACHGSQLGNDLFPGHQDPLDLDRRQPDAWGNKPPASGFYAPDITDGGTNEPAEQPTTEESAE